MSYNIDNFRVKKIKDFYIPDIYKILHKIDQVKPEIFEIKIDEDTEEIKDLHISGEFSGNFYRDIFEDILKTSKGYLKALVVWAEGDCVEWIEINNGDIKYIDLIEDEDE